MEQGGFATEPTAPTRANHTFAGWFAPSATTAFVFATTPITANITLTAQWTAVGPGEPSQNADFTGIWVNGDDRLDITTTGWTGMGGRFQGSGTYTVSGNTATVRIGNQDIGTTTKVNENTIDVNVTVPPAFSVRLTRSFIVSFNADGGTPVPDAQTVEAGDFATEPDTAPTRTGRTFVGWFAPEATTAFAFATTPITANTTLTAQWTDTFTVSFDAGGGTPVPEDQIVQRGGFATEPYPAPTRTSHTFVGWSAPNATIAFPFATTPIYTNITLTARWTEGPFTVSFDAGGGTPEPEDQIVQRFNRATVPTPAPAKEGHDFLGWFASDATAPFNFDAQIFADTSLTARWLRSMDWTAIPAGAGGSSFPAGPGVASRISGIARGSTGWVAVGYGGGMAHSPDGITWTNIPAGVTIFGDIGPARAVAYGNGKWVAVGHSGRMAYSTDGVSWTAIPAGVDGSTFPNNQSIWDVAYGDGVWVAVGAGGRMARSTDGVNWTAIPPRTPHTLSSSKSTARSAATSGSAAWHLATACGLRSAEIHL